MIAKRRHARGDPSNYRSKEQIVSSIAWTSVSRVATEQIVAAMRINGEFSRVELNWLLKPA